MSLLAAGARYVELDQRVVADLLKVFDASCQKYRDGLAPHRMSLLIDLEMARPIEVEVGGPVPRLLVAEPSRPSRARF